MKRSIILMLALMFLIAFSGSSFSQMLAADETQPAFKEGGGKEIPPEKFDEVKSRILQRIDERMNRLRDEKACVENAKNSEGLRKCRPERGPKPGPMGGPR